MTSSTKWQAPVVAMKASANYSALNCQIWGMVLPPEAFKLEETSGNFIDEKLVDDLRGSKALERHVARAVYANYFLTDGVWTTHLVITRQLNMR